MHLACHEAVCTIRYVSCYHYCGIPLGTAVQGTSPVREGETALITAGAGATGSFGVQIARLAGAHVIATCSSPDKARVLQDLGVHRIINYHEEVNTSRVA